MKISNLIYFIILTVFVFGCTNLQNNELKAKNIDDIGIAKINFYEDFHDFGSVKQGIKLSHTFKYKNTGNADLIILNVIPDCGCTVANFNKNSTSPGNEGEIKLDFNTHGQHGGSIYKEVSVKSNAINKIKTLTLKTNIITIH